MSGASALLDAGERDLRREVTSTSARLSAAGCRGSTAVRAPCDPRTELIEQGSWMRVDDCLAYRWNDSLDMFDGTKLRKIGQFCNSFPQLFSHKYY